MQALTDTTLSAHADADAAAASRRILTALPDRAQRDAAAALARAEFGARLKEAREHKGIHLETIATMTKVNESLFVALERGDVSRWPIGIYRRSFFRAYATAIGVSVDSAVNEFLRVFPDEFDTRHPVITAAAVPLRLSLASAPRVRPSRAHLIAAFIDVAVLLMVSSAIVWWSAARPELVLAATTLLYYTIATALFGTSAGAWWLRTRAVRRRFKGLRLAR
jgi:transcriptional regulator with XRE-family HTH domain